MENSAEIEQVAEQENECEQAGCENLFGVQAQVALVGIGIDNTGGAGSDYETVLK